MDWTHKPTDNPQTLICLRGHPGHPPAVSIFRSIAANGHNLVGGLEHVLLSHILGIIIPIDFHIFQRGGPTTNGHNVGVMWCSPVPKPMSSPRVAGVAGGSYEVLVGTAFGLGRWGSGPGRGLVPESYPCIMHVSSMYHMGVSINGGYSYPS